MIHEDKAAAAEDAIRRSDLIICLDLNALHRTDKLEQVLSDSTAEKILIDHHLSPDRERFTLSFSETEISSASFSPTLQMTQLKSREAECGSKRNLNRGTEDITVHAQFGGSGFN